MPFIKVYLHFVWSTKNRIPYLSSPEIRNQLWEHITLNAKTKDIRTLIVGGYHDHCHCLVSFGKDQTISKVAQLLKGECSFWINKSGLILEHFPNNKFDWQDECFVESVSPEGLFQVRDYILNQEEHHKHFTFEQEYEKLMTEFNEQNLFLDRIEPKS